MDAEGATERLVEGTAVGEDGRTEGLVEGCVEGIVVGAREGGCDGDAEGAVGTAVTGIADGLRIPSNVDLNFVKSSTPCQGGGKGRREEGGGRL